MPAVGIFKGRFQSDNQHRLCNHPRWAMRTHQIFDDQISDFAFGFEHLKDFIAKQLFKLTSFRRWAYHEGGIVVKDKDL
jgi:hypothetical protein